MVDATASPTLAEQLARFVVRITAAVADGMVAHYPPPLQRAPEDRLSGAAESRRTALVGMMARSLPGAVIATLVVYVLLRPLLGLGHELVVAGLAWLAHTVVASDCWVRLLSATGLDPVYAGAAVRAAGGVQVTGMAVANPVGGWLHALAPVIFHSPGEVVRGAGVSMVAAPGTPALGRGLAEFGSDIVWLALGVSLFRKGRRGGYPLAVLGLLIQAQIVVNHFLDVRLELSDLEASGLPFAVALAMPSAGGRWFTVGFGRLPLATQQFIVGGILVVLGYVSALALVLCVRAAWQPGHALARRLRQTKPRTGSETVTPERVPSLPARVACAAAALVVAGSPIGALARGESNWQGSQMVAPSAVADGTPLASHDFGSHDPVQDAVTPGPTVVKLEQTSDGAAWRYLVNGQPTIVRGVGYNPWYSKLGVGNREQLYERDFSAMHGLASTRSRAGSRPSSTM